jgi:hypothetical protein
LFANGIVKCWGQNDFGQLGQGDIQARGINLGNRLSQISAIDLGNFNTKSIFASYNQTCAVSLLGELKCWGNNSNGQLGQQYQNNIGDSTGEMGRSLLPVDLGTFSNARSISIGDDFSCAVILDGRIKCFGKNSSGQLGIERNFYPYDLVGDILTEVGDFLIPVVL